MTPSDKPMLDSANQIKHLQEKGVKFDIISLEDAKPYLEQNNNYFKLRAYRKNFKKHKDDTGCEVYVDLDFAMLKDLSIIDMRLRYVVIQMALDIEHFAKVKLIRAVEESADDGYQVVSDYFNYLEQNDSAEGTSRCQSLHNELNRNQENPYCGGIIAKYNGCYPIWAFVEIIPLGSLIHFYGFCADRFERKDMKDDFHLLLSIKELRNASAHNNCIIHDMGAKDSIHKPNYKMLRAISTISKSTRNARLKNERTRQLTTLLYAHSSLVTSGGVHKYRKELLHDLVERMFYHIDYYKTNETIISSFDFFQKTVDIFFT